MVLPRLPHGRGEELTCFGLIMVFSSSTVTMAALGKSPFLQLLNQGAFCLIGLVLGFVALMMPVTFWKRTGVLFVVGACLLQALSALLALGIDVYGNKRSAEPWLHHYPAG